MNQASLMIWLNILWKIQEYVSCIHNYTCRNKCMYVCMHDTSLLWQSKGLMAFKRSSQPARSPLWHWSRMPDACGIGKGRTVPRHKKSNECINPCYWVTVMTIHSWNEVKGVDLGSVETTFWRAQRLQVGSLKRHGWDASQVTPVQLAWTTQFHYDFRIFCGRMAGMFLWIPLPKRHLKLVLPTGMTSWWQVSFREISNAKYWAPWTTNLAHVFYT